jgi:hypothetical protein
MQSLNRQMGQLEQKGRPLTKINRHVMREAGKGHAVA